MKLSDGCVTKAELFEQESIFAEDVCGLFAPASGGQTIECVRSELQRGNSRNCTLQEAWDSVPTGSFASKF